MRLPSRTNIMKRPSNPSHSFAWSFPRASHRGCKRADALLRGAQSTVAASLMFSANCFGSDVLIVDWDGNGAREILPLASELQKAVLTSEAHNYLITGASWLPVEGYDPQPDKTAQFQMAISSSAGHGPAVPHIMRLEPRGSQGTVTVMVQGSEGLPPQMRGVLVFEKDHFLNGSNEAGKTVQFDAMSRLAFRGILDGKAPAARWLLRDGEKWFVSETMLAPQLSYNVAEDRELVDPASVAWAEYDVTAVPLGEAPEVFAPRRFENITAVGIFWDAYGSEAVIGGTSFSRMAVDAFQTQALVP